jgi:hypothetical protein
MKRESCCMLLAVAALLAGAFAHASELDWAAFGVNPNVSYSATRHIETDEGSLDMKEHRAPQMFRADLVFEGQQGSMISREDRQVAYMIMPAMNAYMEIPTEQVLEATYMPKVAERTELGRETINGHASTKYHAVFVDADNGRSKGHLWVTDSGVPIKMDMVYEEPGARGERVVMELRDLQIGPQNAALFEVPEGFQSFNMGAALRGLTSRDPEAGGEQSADGGVGAAVTEMATEAAREEARRTAVDEARRATRDGLRSIFGR